MGYKYTSVDPITTNSSAIYIDIATETLTSSPPVFAGSHSPPPESWSSWTEQSTNNLAQTIGLNHGGAIDYFEINDSKVVLPPDFLSTMTVELVPQSGNPNIVHTHYCSGGMTPNSTTNPCILAYENQGTDIYNGQLTKFLELYNEVNQSGALNDPAIKQVIDQLGQEVLEISNSVNSTAFEVAFPPDVTSPTTFSIETLNQNVASRTTNLNSAGICTTGDGTDSGIQCF